MENKNETASVPYFIHEGVIARMERNNRRMLIALIVVVIALFANNVAWLAFEHIHHPAAEETLYEQGTPSLSNGETN